MGVVTALISLGALGCPGPNTPARLATPNDIASSDDAPRVTMVKDLGAPTLDRQRDLSTKMSDGVGVVGELLLVAGEDFGRLPRVTVDGRTAVQLGRTDRGGVIIRIPWGVRTGPRRIEVINAHGRSAATYPLRRFALATVPSKDAVYPLRLEPHGKVVAHKPLMVPNAHLVRYSADGRIAYVSGRDDQKSQLLIAAVDMVTPHAPQLTAHFKLPGQRLIALTAAERAPIALAISDSHIVFVDTSIPQRPSLLEPRALPKELAADGVVSADMDPQGELLAVLLARDNQLRLFRVRAPNELRPLASIRVLPGSRSSLVRDVRFAVDSRTIWVISGDNARTAKRRGHPLRLSLIEIQQHTSGRARNFGILSVWRTLDVPHRAAPVDLAVARGQPLATGRTVRVPPKNAAVFITAHDAKLLRLARTRLDRKRGLRRAVRILKGIEPLGTVVRTDIQGKGGPMFTSSSLLGPIDITSDSQMLLVAGAKVEVTQKPAAVKLVYGVSSCRVFGKIEPRFIPLAEVDPEALARPFMLGDVRIQP